MKSKVISKGGIKMVLEQGVHSGADHQGRKDDAFLDIQFTITERWREMKGTRRVLERTK